MATTRVEKCNRCGRPKDEGEGWNKNALYRDGSGVYFFHDTCPEKVCKEIMSGGVAGRGKRCSKDGKGVNDKGEWLCGVHYGAFKRVKANDAKRRVEYERRQANYAANDANNKRSALAAEILNELGLTATAHNSGDVLIEPAALFELLGIGAKLPEKVAKT